MTPSLPGSAPLTRAPTCAPMPAASTNMPKTAAHWSFNTTSWKAAFSAAIRSCWRTWARIPITLGNGRVTVEEAPVEFAATHPLLSKPNRITNRDFEGWVQERGLYFASAWDPKYETLFQMHDPGEAPLKGGTLYTKYGKGAYIFTPLSWFRQLPAGVPGAYRIFANFLSAGSSQ